MYVFHGIMVAFGHIEWTMNMIKIFLSYPSSSLCYLLKYLLPAICMIPILISIWHIFYYHHFLNTMLIAYMYFTGFSMDYKLNIQDKYFRENPYLKNIWDVCLFFLGDLCFVKFFSRSINWPVKFMILLLFISENYTIVHMHHICIQELG